MKFYDMAERLNVALNEAAYKLRQARACEMAATHAYERREDTEAAAHIRDRNDWIDELVKTVTDEAAGIQRVAEALQRYVHPYTLGETK